MFDLNISMRPLALNTVHHSESPVVYTASLVRVLDCLSESSPHEAALIDTTSTKLGTHVPKACNGTTISRRPLAERYPLAPVGLCRGRRSLSCSLGLTSVTCNSSESVGSDRAI
jgi:hypothetical protein